MRSGGKVIESGLLGGAGRPVESNQQRQQTSPCAVLTTIFCIFLLYIMLENNEDKFKI